MWYFTLHSTHVYGNNISIITQFNIHYLVTVETWMYGLDFHQKLGNSDLEENKCSGFHNPNGLCAKCYYHAHS